MSSVNKINSNRTSLIAGFIFMEDFGTPSGSLPAGWATVDNSMNGLQWHWTRTGSATNSGSLNPSGTTASNGYVIADSDSLGMSVGGEDADLLSPAINCSTNSAVILSFNQYFVQYNSGLGTVYTSNDGISWTQVYQVGPTLGRYDATLNPDKINIDISSIAAGSSTVYLKFKWQGDYDFFWQIDDISLFEPAQIDGGVITAFVPSSCDFSGKMPVSVLIKNYGLDSISNFPVAYQSNNGPVVSEVITDTILPGDTLAYTFLDSLDMSIAGGYSIKAYTNIASDGILANDTSSTFTENVNSSDLASDLTMGFEATDSFSGWRISEDVNADGKTWQVESGNIGNGSDKAIKYSFNRSNNADDYFYTKCLKLDSTHQYRIDFYDRIENASYPEKLELRIGKDQNSTAMTDLIKDLGSLVNATYSLSSAKFIVPSSGIYFIGFHVYSDPFMFNLYVDDIVISDLGVTGVDEIVQNDFIVYPNPSSGEFNLSLNTGTSGIVSVFNVLGENVYSQYIQPASSTSLELQHLAPGTYFVRLQTKDEVITKKILIKK